MRTPLSFGLVLTILASLTTSGASGSTMGPVLVVTISNGDSALVAWIPPPEQVSTYKVYGITATGSKVWLDSTPQLTDQVTGNYAGYAVSAVSDGVESNATTAVIVDDCVHIEPSDMPPVVIESDCGPSVKITFPGEGELKTPDLIH